MNIFCTDNPSDKDWLELRGEFFPEDFPGEHEQFLRSNFGPGGFTAFVARDADGTAMGFAEVAIRQDYVNGCKFRPALYLEGIYVRPAFRGQGVARELCAAAAGFGASHGCREFASDVFIDDQDSLAAHAALGFAETERVVYFRKIIAPEETNQEPQ